MGFIDQASTLDPVMSINPVAVAATTTGTAVALVGCRSVTAIISTGVISAADASNLCTVTLETSPDNSNWTSLPTADYIPVIPNGASVVWDRIINANTETGTTSFGAKIKAVNTTHVRLVFTETASFSAIMGGSIVRGNVPILPVNA